MESCLYTVNMMIWNTKGTNIDPWGTPWLIVSDFRSTNVNRLPFFSHRSSPHDWKTVKITCFYTLHTPGIFFFFFESGVIRRHLACCVCFVAACIHVLWWQVFTMSQSGESNIITHLVTLNLVWAGKQVMVLFLPRFVHNPLHVLTQLKCRLSFPRVLKQ